MNDDAVSAWLTVAVDAMRQVADADRDRRAAVATRNRALRQAVLAGCRPTRVAREVGVSASLVRQVSAGCSHDPA